MGRSPALSLISLRRKRVLLQARRSPLTVAIWPNKKTSAPFATYGPGRGHAAAATAVDPSALTVGSHTLAADERTGELKCSARRSRLDHRPRPTSTHRSLCQVAALAGARPGR